MHRKFGVALVAAAALPVAGRLPAAAADDVPQVYVAMGDSVTQMGSTSPYPERFFGALQERARADVLHNVGANGATSSGILGSQLTTARQLIDDGSTDTSVVTVDIGGNDLLGSSCSGFSTSFSLSGCQTMLQSFEANLTSLLTSLDSALAADPGAEQVLVMAYYNPASGRSGAATAASNFDLGLLGSDLQLDCGASGTDRGLNDVIACVGAQNRALLADAHPPFQGKGATWFSDDIHPNDLGHQAIADAFTQASTTLAPIAVAGPDQSVAWRAGFDLDAGASSDPEDGALSYLWEQVGGPPAVIQSPRSARTSAGGVDGPATLTFRVTVSDQHLASTTDEVVVQVAAK